MENSTYWQERFKILEEAALSKGEEFYKELEKQYRLAYDETEKTILQWYNRFAEDNQMDLVEAKKVLTEGELEEFKWSLEEYIKKASDKELSEKWAKELQNASTRVHISRLDALRIQIQNTVENVYNKQLTGMQEIAETIYEDNYYHTAYEIQKGINTAWKIKGLENRAIEKVMTKPWNGR